MRRCCVQPSEPVLQSSERREQGRDLVLREAHGSGCSPCSRSVSIDSATAADLGVGQQAGVEKAVLGDCRAIGDDAGEDSCKAAESTAETAWGCGKNTCTRMPHGMGHTSQEVTNTYILRLLSAGRTCPDHDVNAACSQEQQRRTCNVADSTLIRLPGHTTMSNNASCRSALVRLPPSPISHIPLYSRPAAVHVSLPFLITHI